MHTHSVVRPKIKPQQQGQLAMLGIANGFSEDPSRLLRI